MAKKNKNKQKQQNQISGQTKPAVGKSPEMLALENRRDELNAQILQVQNQKNELEKEKRDLDLKRQQAEKEKIQAEKSVEQLEREAAEIRAAIRKIEELKLARHTESAEPEILALMGAKADWQNRNGQNDQAILAVAARYKLNDIVLYTEDKNLKNHATDVGIKTI